MLFRLESIQFKEGRDFVNVLRFFFFILPLLEIIIIGEKRKHGIAVFHGFPIANGECCPKL